MAENKTITVAGCQMLQNLGNREANIRTAMEIIKATPGHDIYVLPAQSCFVIQENPHQLYISIISIFARIRVPEI